MAAPTSGETAELVAQPADLLAQFPKLPVGFPLAFLRLFRQLFEFAVGFAKQRPNFFQGHVV